MRTTDPTPRARARRALPLTVLPAAGELPAGGVPLDVTATLTVGEPGSVAGELAVLLPGGEAKKVGGQGGLGAGWAIGVLCGVAGGCGRA